MSPYIFFKSSRWVLTLIFYFLILQERHFSFIYYMESLALQNRLNEWVNCFETARFGKEPIDCYTSGYGNVVRLLAFLHLFKYSKCVLFSLIEHAIFSIGKLFWSLMNFMITCSLNKNLLLKLPNSIRLIDLCHGCL